MKRVLHWFRRDLRLSDNTALFQACRQAQHVIPVFILEDAFRTGPDVGAGRLAFLLRSLDELQKNLRALGSDLILRHGKSESVIPLLARELKARGTTAEELQRLEQIAEIPRRKLVKLDSADRIDDHTWKRRVVTFQK